MWVFLTLKIVFNAYINGAWGPEERAANPMNKYASLDVRIRTHHDHFEVWLEKILFYIFSLIIFSYLLIIHLLIFINNNKLIYYLQFFLLFSLNFILYYIIYYFIILFTYLFSLVLFVYFFNIFTFFLTWIFLDFMWSKAINDFQISLASFDDKSSLYWWWPLSIQPWRIQRPLLC